MYRHRIAIATLTGLVLFLPMSARAQALWLCGLSQDATRLVCLADVDPADPVDAEAAAGPPAAAVRGTVFPLDPRRLYTVDLMGPATEMEMVAQLAQATLCHRSPGCRALFVHEPVPALAARSPLNRWASVLPR
jgi:hypothetical protein